MSNIVGYALLFGMVIAIGAAALLLGTGIIEDLQTNRDASEFEPDIESTTEYSIVYSKGESFTQSGTTELQIVTDSETITVEPSDWDGSQLDTGDTLLENAEDDIDLGETVDIVFVDDEGNQMVIDTIIFPTASQVGTNVGSSGSASGTGTIEIVIE